MNTTQQALYDRLVALEIDEPGAKLTFTGRLARENGWDLPFARRVVAEYKRFMFLAIAAGHPVTPSQQVDQAWHLHLLYTRSYWDELCGQVLGQPVHHGPTQGGPAEQARYRDWYEWTKTSYRRLLDESPPADIWPASDARFGDDLYERWVNTRRNWVIPKPRLVWSLAAWIALALVVLATICLIVGKPRLARADDIAGDHGAQQYRWVTRKDDPLEKQRVRFPSPRGTSTEPQWMAQPIDSVLSPPIQRRQAAERDKNSQRVPWDSKNRPRTNLGHDNQWIIALLVPWICAILLALLCGLFTDPCRCPACKKPDALTLSGKVNDPAKNSTTQQEWICKHCGFRTWKPEAGAGGYGGCGDGGCGGCGGCGG